MANFSALGMRPHPLHPHAVRLWLQPLQLAEKAEKHRSCAQLAIHMFI